MGWNEQKSAAVTKLTLRLAVAGYLIYLAWKIVGGTLDGTSPIIPWLSYAICAVFILAVIGLGLYSFREFWKAWNASSEVPGKENDTADTIE